ncbi:MAG: hypothetical protein ABSG90_13810 [Dehalococcoidia bacterium]|jgi:hypothetical protein
MAEEGSTIKTDDRGDYISPVDEVQACDDEWQRFVFYLQNSHIDYVDRANRNFRYFYGAGQQWTDTDRDYFEKVLFRRCHEENHILPAVQTATGEQIFTRADITFKPRKGASSEAVAKILSQLALHVQIDNGYHRKEKTLWKDGLIKQRGYFDIRMKFDENLQGDILIQNRNPITVLPDLFTESYDPNEWNEVTNWAWLSLDQIEGMYGAEARHRAELTHGWYSDNPMNDEFHQRNWLDTRYGFGIGGVRMMYERAEAGEKRLRVLERQYYRWNVALCYVNPKNQDFQVVPEHVKQQEAEKKAQEMGYILAKVNTKRVYWRVSTRYCMLHDTWSPYRSLTIVPYFYIFDYGATLGMVDNAISPQELRNKSLSNGIHIMNTTANSGWKIPYEGEKSTLKGMTVEELRNQGAKSGLVMGYDKSIGEPQKITPNQFPEGLKYLVEIGKQGIKDTTGIQDADSMLRSHVPGDSTQSAMFQSKLILADPLDNLESTRSFVGRKIIELAQDFMSAERLFTITDIDEYGKEKQEQFTINEVQADGSILNDITVGEYDVVVTTKPTARTWLESQFNELKSLKELGVGIPDDEMVRRSNIDNKHDLADRMGKPKDDGGAAQANMELIKAKVKKMMSEANATDAKAIQSYIESIFGSVSAAQILSQVPTAAPIADELLLSCGFKDAQIPEVISKPGDLTAVPTTPEAQNTHPNFPPLPPSSTAGIDKGIETGATP